jgi:hypothetical protein
VVGASLGSAGNCEHPLAVVDDATGLNLVVVRCKQRRSSRCAGCGERHRGDVARVGRSGWLGWENVLAFFVTFTAPGVDVLPWDTRQCSHRPGVRCSGKIGCRAALAELVPWNDSLGQRWSWMMTYIRRELPGVTVEFFKAVEPQRRGALHLHVMFRVDASVCPERFAAVMRLCAERWGFGPQTDIQTVMLVDEREVARRAGYCAKYAAKLADADRRFVNPDSGEIVSLRCRAWSKSGKWGVSMRSIEVDRRQWAAAGVRTAPAGRAPVVAALLDLNSDCYTEGPIEVAVVDDSVEIATV